MKQKLLLSTLALSLSTLGMSSWANEHGHAVTQVQPWTQSQWNITLAELPMGNAREGEKLHREALCMTCHGAQGIAPSRNAPSLAGNTPEYTVKTLLDYQSGLRNEGDGKSAVMQAAAHALSLQDMTNLGAYYAEQTIPSNAAAVLASQPEQATQVERLVRKGDARRMITPCASCHGVHGEGNQITPALAGQTPHYFVRTMQAYKNGHRFNDINAGMSQFTHDLTDAEIDALAQYYASLIRTKGE